jgi:hypothetical protein
MDYIATAIVVVIGLAVAVYGAWDAARCRHDMACHHKRRRTDPQ